jgi:hypothetical protein
VRWARCSTYSPPPYNFLEQKESHVIINSVHFEIIVICLFIQQEADKKRKRSTRISTQWWELNTSTTWKPYPELDSDQLEGRMTMYTMDQVRFRWKSKNRNKMDRTDRNYGNTDGVCSHGIWYWFFSRVPSVSSVWQLQGRNLPIQKATNLSNMKCVLSKDETWCPSQSAEVCIKQDESREIRSFPPFHQYAKYRGRNQILPIQKATNLSNIKCVLSKARWNLVAESTSSGL